VRNLKDEESVKTNTEKLWVDFVDNRCKKDVLGKKLSMEDLKALFE